MIILCFEGRTVTILLEPKRQYIARYVHVFMGLIDILDEWYWEFEYLANQWSWKGHNGGGVECGS